MKFHRLQKIKQYRVVVSPLRLIQLCCSFFHEIQQIFLQTSPKQPVTTLLQENSFLLKFPTLLCQPFRLRQLLLLSFLHYLKDKFSVFNTNFNPIAFRVRLILRQNYLKQNEQPITGCSFFYFLFKILTKEYSSSPSKFSILISSFVTENFTE